MGYTAHTKKLVENILSYHPVESVIDLGAQNDFSGPGLPAPYISEWYKSFGIKYACIDLNGENDANVIDLTYPIPSNTALFKHYSDDHWAYSMQVDLVSDIGTSEHLGRNGKFDWEAIYNGWVNKWNLLKMGGISLNENPLTKNWIGHGFNYYTKEFYLGLCALTNSSLLQCDLHPACGNMIDGWNVWSIIRKNQESFISLQEFKTLDLRQS